MTGKKRFFINIIKNKISLKELVIDYSHISKFIVIAFP